MTNNDPALVAARAAKSKIAELFGRFAKVNGIGIMRREGVYAVKINLEESPPTNQELPDEVDGVPVVVHVVGRILKR